MIYDKFIWWMDMTEEFKSLVKYPRYSINRSGDLLDTKTGKLRTWYVQKPIKEMGGRVRNIKRGYRIARILDEEGNKRHVFQHRIIAEAFITCPGNPDDYVVNHIDGDGGNNDIDNLEWTTYTGNMLHAYGTGLCKNTRSIQVRNAITGAITEFTSIAEFCREYNLHHATASHRLKQNAGKVYDGVAVKFADDPTPWTDTEGRSVKPKAVCAIDLVKRELLVAGNQLELSRMLGLTEGAINASLRKNSLLPIGPYLIMWHDTREMAIPEFSDKQRELFALPRKRADQGGWLEIDEVEGTQKVYLLDEAAARHGVNVSTIQLTGKSGKMLKDRYRFEYISPVPTDYSPLAA